MPFYSYTNEDRGETIQRSLTYEQDVPKRVKHKGVWYDRDIVTDMGGTKSGDIWTNHASDSMGVLPHQVPELIQHCKDQGVNVECDSQGRVKCTSMAHHRKVMEARGFHNNASFY